MRHLLAALVCLTLLGVAHAEDKKDVAREAFRLGTLQYDLGDFKAALAAFKKAYLQYEDPAFLFNIAQCERQLGDKTEALRTYRVFLNKAASAAQRAQVEKIVRELEIVIEQDTAVAARPPTETMAPGATRGGEVRSPPPLVEMQGVEVSSPAPVTAFVIAPPVDKPLTKKGWFWGVVVGGAVVVAGAVTLGVVLGTRSRSYAELTY
jgi:tetratricopeptide (TPR) repeat protein